MLLVLVTVSMPRVYVCRHGLDERLQTLAAKKNAKMLLHHTRTTSNHTRQLRKKVSESFAFAGLIDSILLVIGAAKGRPALLVPHIVSSVIGIVLMVILSILLFALIDDTGARIISGFIPLLGLPLPIYFCLVVISFYKQQMA